MTRNRYPKRMKPEISTGHRHPKPIRGVKMIARFEITRPDEVKCTMSLTMPLKEWKRLRDQLKSDWPSYDLSRNIGELVRQAEQTFYANDDQETAQ